MIASFPSRAIAILLLLSVSALGCSSESTPPEPAQSAAQAGIQKLSETTSTVKMKFVDSGGDELVLDFEKVQGQGDYWKPAQSLAWDEHIFGEEKLVLPSVEQISKEGRDPTDPLSTFDPSIHDVVADEVSIFALEGGAMAIAVWEKAAVSHVYLAGTGVIDYVLQNGDGIEGEFCSVLRQHCIEQGDVVPCTDADLQPCILLARFCDEDDRQLACAKLVNLCTCDPETHEDDNIAACAAGAQFCGPPPPPDPGPSIKELLEWILEVLEEILRRLRELEE